MELRPGDKIKLYDLEREEDEYGRKNKASTICYKVWAVEKCYPHVILLVDKSGNHECFSYWHIKKHMKPPVKKKNEGGHLAWVWEE